MLFTVECQTASGSFSWKYLALDVLKIHVELTSKQFLTS